MPVKSTISLFCACLSLPLVAMADSSPAVAHKAILDLELARTLVKAAEQTATAKGWPCAIVVVDDGGWPILGERMNGAPVVAGIQLAEGKARTSALFKRPSGDLENAVNGGRQAALSAGLVMMKGAQPIRLEGQVIGAIGISADTPAHDDEIALAAIAALPSQAQP